MRARPQTARHVRSFCGQDLRSERRDELSSLLRRTAGSLRSAARLGLRLNPAVLSIEVTDCDCCQYGGVGCQWEVQQIEIAIAPHRLDQVPTSAVAKGFGTAPSRVDPPPRPRPESLQGGNSREVGRQRCRTLCEDFDAANEHFPELNDFWSCDW
jgi:hypothetical protein